MPRLIADASNFAFPGGIAENEAVFSAIGHELLPNRRVLLLLVQQLIILVHDIYCQPGLVLTGTGACYPERRLVFRLRLGIINLIGLNNVKTLDYLARNRLVIVTQLHAKKKIMMLRLIQRPFLIGRIAFLSEIE